MNSHQTQGLLSLFLKEVRFNKIVKYIVGKKVLDVGCGDGSLVKKLNEGIFYLGIDKFPIKKSKNSHREYNYSRIDIEKSFKLNEKFDTIVLGAVIEHLISPEAVLNKLLKCLTPGGVIVITTPTKFGIILHKILSLFGITSREAAHEHSEGLEKDDFIKIQKTLRLRLVKYEKFLFGLNQVIVYSAS